MQFVIYTSKSQHHIISPIITKLQKQLIKLKQFPMPSNFWMFFITALIPLIVGFIWYNPKVMGSSWMKVNGFKEADFEGGNMFIILGLSYLFGVFISFGLSGIVVHQPSVFQVMMPDVMEAGNAAQQQFNDFMGTYGDRFRDWKHGAIHGILFCVLLVLPLIAINALFERRGWKYIMIHFGYWLISMTLIGAVLCQTLVYS